MIALLMQHEECEWVEQEGGGEEIDGGMIWGGKTQISRLSGNCLFSLNILHARCWVASTSGKGT